MQVMNNTMNQNNTSAADAMNHQPPRSFTFADNADHQAKVTEANAVVVGEKNIATTSANAKASGRSPRSRSPRVDCTNAFLNSSSVVDPQQQSVKQQHHQPTLVKNTALLLTPVTTTQTQPTTTNNIPNTIMNKNKNVGADDIHPLAMAAITMQQRKKSSQSNASHKWSATNGIGGWMEKTTKKNNTLLSSTKGEQTTTTTNKNNDTTTTIDSPQMNDKQIVYENSSSPEISELTPPTPPPTDTNTNNQIAKTASATTMKKNKSSDNLGGSQTNNKNNNKLSTKQQIAMNNFLKAQTSGNPISKEEMWKELVRTMKQDIDYDHHHVHPSSSSYNRSNSGSSSNNNHRGRLNSKGGGSSNNKSWSTNKDDILGLIRIGGGMKIGGNASDVISIESGLTSEGFGGGTFAGFGGKSVKSANLEGWGEDGMWNPTPHGSPRKSESGGGGNNGGTVGYGALHMRSFTPPNVPVLSTKGDLPLVSPLSVDGSFDTNDVEGEGEGLDVPKELGLENSPFDSEKDKKKGYEKNVTPPENTFTKKHSKKKKEKSPCFFNLGESFADNAKKLWDTDDPTLSFADLSSGHDNDDNTASVSCAEKRRPTSSPPLLPMPRRSESPIVRSPSSAHQQQQYRKQGQSRSLMVQSVEGEVIPFHDMGKHQSLTREDEGTNNIPSVFDAWATSNSQPPLLPDEPTMSPRKEPEEEVTPVRQSPTRSSKRRVKTPGQSLEAQILSVLQQQPESHVVDEAVDDDDDDVHDDKEEFDRSSPLPTAPTTSTKPKKKKKIKSGTVGSTASAQDILLELRSSTPCTLQSGNSSCNRTNRNDPPLGCISIGRGQQNQMVNKQQLNQKAQCPSSEESSNNKNNANKGGPTSATKALAPSRRDLPRPNRINRRSASEPTPVVPNQGAAVTTFVAKTSSVSSSQGSSTKTEIAANVLDNNSNKPSDNVKTESPHERYRKAIGTNNKQVKSPVPPSRISRLFPNTHPASMKRRPTPIRSTNPFDSYPSTNPFDSPLRLKKEDPFDSQSSPIAMEVSGESLDVSCSLEIDASAAQRSASSGSVTTSSERAIAPPSSLPSRHDRLPPHPSSTLVLPPSRRDTDTTLKAGALQAAKSPRDSRPSPPTFPQSSRSSPHNIDEIRASISQLKSNGVGGVGKSTSTLVRNEQTGRYVIQDIDDNHFEMMHTKVENNEEDAEENSEEEGYVGVVETSMSSDESSYQVLTSQTKEPSSSLDNSARYKAQQSPIKFMMTNALMSESVLDDDAVDAAVQAAIDEEMSTASSSLNEDWTDTTEGNQEQPEQAHIQADTEEDDFFVIKRPQTGGEWGTKWSTFESSDKAFDNFDIQPSGSMDDWENDDDDFVNSDRQWENDGFVHSWGTEEKAISQKEFFPSPTSVATNRRKIL